MALSIVGCATNRTPRQPSDVEPATNDQLDTSIAQPPPSGRSITKLLSTQGRLNDTRLGEVSGLAASNLDANRLWAINDSGNLAELYALTHQATLDQVWQVAIDNRDWEAMASTSLGGVSYLLVADVGDNLQAHEESFLHLFEEPSTTSDNNKPLNPINTLRFAYPDGPKNVEAMAVNGFDVYLLTKERLTRNKAQPSRIYQLTLQGNNLDALQTAVYQGDVRMPNRNWKTRLLTKVLNIDPLQPTDLVISDDNQHAYVLNYLHVLHYERIGDESWPDAFSKPPKIMHHHGLRQAEALTVSNNGNVWVTSENVGARLLASTGAQSSNASRVSP